MLSCNNVLAPIVHLFGRISSNERHAFHLESLALFKHRNETEISIPSANQHPGTFSSTVKYSRYRSRVISNTGTQLDSFAESERARLPTDRSHPFYHRSERNVWHSGVPAAIVFHKTVKRPVVKRGGLPVAVLSFRFPGEQTRDTAFSRVLRFSRPTVERPLFLSSFFHRRGK